ncbi:Multidrug resistance protein MdtA [Fundidesulfovibrio magnetotacticus]|uniref:Multidrug resistance protein MdtA n=1 Tax=Fundidesulfovibrio magnetotacticus TaxID=2730080 RepID=A0A6V8LR77_9BACT|nr:efflux RND transporter periplasmic adaptor subunit [Fundidesulfovibrio magnetotacticus]GFK92838.1 Multidrug resistance protein MdtA [Fundidesulfovibrio magnetotacticus]
MSTDHAGAHALPAPTRRRGGAPALSLPRPSRLTAALALLAACLLSACGKEEPVRPAPRSVQAPVAVVRAVEAVECRSFPAQVESLGSVTLAGKSPGAVVEVFAQEGQALKAGDPILRLDDQELKSREQSLTASMAQAASERQAVAAKAAHARANLERLAKLLTQKVISQDDFERARTEALALAREEEAIAARERSVAAQRDELRAQGQYLHITAPFDGVLSRRFVDLGAFVTAGQPLALVDAVSSGFDLTAQVDESLLYTLHVGQPLVGAVPALSPAPFAARVRAVVGRVDPATRTFRLKAELPPLGAQPRAGLYGRLFVPARTARKILVPAACLAPRGDLPAVFTVDDKGLAALRVVKTGGRFLKVEFDGKPFLTDSEAFDDPSREAFVEILSGLSEGDRVACAGSVPLRDGDRVEAAP